MPTSVLTAPQPEHAKDVISESLTEEVIIICCSCDVEYSGRADGYLPTGDRTILIKPDGNFLVIGATKHKARNWQPTGAETDVHISDGTLVLESHRTSPKEEELIVYCDDLYEVITYDSGEDPDVSLSGTEDDMHERIMETPELIEDGFTTLEHEKTVDSGRSIDVFGEDDEGRPVIIEVKRRRGQRKDVDQLRDYTAQFRGSEGARGILVAPSASENVLDALDERDLEFVELQPKSAEEIEG